MGKNPRKLIVTVGVRNVGCKQSNVNNQVSTVMKMSTANKETRLNVRITPDELMDIKQFAESKNMTLTDFVLTAARSYMDKPSDVQSELLAISRRVMELERAVFHNLAA